MLEKNAPRSPQIDEAAATNSGVAPEAPLGSAQRVTAAGTWHWYPLQFLIPLITKPRPGTPPQEHP